MRRVVGVVTTVLVFLSIAQPAFGYVKWDRRIEGGNDSTGQKSQVTIFDWVLLNNGEDGPHHVSSVYMEDPPTFLHMEAGACAHLSGRYAFYAYNSNPANWNSQIVVHFWSGLPANTYYHFEVNNFTRSMDGSDEWRAAVNGTLMKKQTLNFDRGWSMCSSERENVGNPGDDARSTFTSLQRKDLGGTWRTWSNSQDKNNDDPIGRWGSFSPSHWYHRI